MVLGIPDSTQRGKSEKNSDTQHPDAQGPYSAMGYTGGKPE